jgi:predicted acyl esterase
LNAESGLQQTGSSATQSATFGVFSLNLRNSRVCVELGRPYELRVALLPTSFLVRAGERLRPEISNTDSQIADAPSTHWYATKVDTDTFHHGAAHPSRLVLPERPRP